MAGGGELGVVGKKAEEESGKRKRRGNEYSDDGHESRVQYSTE